MSTIDLEYDLGQVFARERGRLYMSGIQALVRLPMMQRRLDRAAGLNTAGLISGYRGSPLGAYDQQLWRAEKTLNQHDVIFQPGLNEDLAATALWGSQMHAAYGPTKADGVFGIWYAKGPGVDRSGDVLRCANTLGTSALGGVLALAGDDHAAQSSTFPHQTDGIFQSVMMPILQPSSVSEILSLGLAGFALSRFAGVWVAMKTIAEVVESAAGFEAPDPYPMFRAPADFVMPEHGLNWDPALGWPAGRIELERRLIEERIPAVLAWARANNIDGIVQDAPRRRTLIVTVGKAHQDLMEALAGLGIDQRRAEALGLVIYKVAMTWPLETTRLRQLAAEVETILVVEEKRGYVEEQLKTALFNMPADQRPKIVGKHDLDGQLLLPEVLELNPLLVARALASVVSTGAGPFWTTLRDWEARCLVPDRAGFANRKAFFCSGCPHNTSTRTPEGSISGGGIGCHVLALAEPELRTPTFSQMGGEGIQWVGAAPFVQTPHLFQNLGDGTYQHSGLLAIRAALASDANITFKILYNDAVAMTGGQMAEGHMDPAKITRELAGEGVKTIVMVSDDPEKWRLAQGLATGVEIFHRDHLDAVQRRLRETKGVTAIVYEQTCATEKRRRRKRGTMVAPTKRLMINPRVCEGCGDCQVQSNCIAVEPLDTAYGTKRKINQSACNIDLSCVKGFCPSFVEVEGGVAPKPDAARLAGEAAALAANLPLPPHAALTGDFNIYVAGVGGTGVLTLGALIGTAAHVEGLATSTLDFTGMAQKNGAVASQIRMAPKNGDLHAVRIGGGQVDLMLAADLIVAGTAEALSGLSNTRSKIALNLDTTPTADAVTHRDYVLPLDPMARAIRKRAKETQGVKATRLAEGLFGDATTANTLLLGFAYQKGWLPLSAEALLRAIELNGVAVKANIAAFAWGRIAAHDMIAAERAAGLHVDKPVEETIEQLVERLAGDLVSYQGEAYAARYRAIVAVAVSADAAAKGDGALARNVARQLYRLMAYKDEYEVARLYAEPAFAQTLSGQFETHKSLGLWLAPPLLSRMDPATGRPKKMRFGPWIFPMLRMLAMGKALRGTALDPFGYSAERREERALIATYEDDVRKLCDGLDAARYAAATKLAAWPSEARGFGPVKAAGLEKARANRDALWAALKASAPLAIAAE